MPAGATRASLSLALATPGTAWLDLLQFYDISPRIAARAEPDGSFAVELESYMDDAELRYTLDGSEPTARSALYTGPFEVTRTTPVRCAVLRDGQTVAFSEVTLHRHDAAGRFLDLRFPASPRYPAAGPESLVDGRLGGTDFRDGNWQGFEEVDLDAVVDLGRDTAIQSVSARFLQSFPSWIWLPRQVSYYTSADGRRYELLGRVLNDVPQNQDGLFARDFTLAGLSATARFLRVHAESVGQCPPWHAGAGGKAWLFVDEIQVNPR
ncbi:MAG: FN3 associated domain-containing protein [Gemmatimonadota bacterium]